MAEQNTITGSIIYVTGDAVEPLIDGVRIVAFMTNDTTPNWGGGIARQIARRKPEVQQIFRTAAKSHPEALQLGKAIFIRDSETLIYAALIAQQGWGKSESPRISYDALSEALRRLGKRAGDIGATVHMPRIGTGAAGGTWSEISPLIEKFVCPHANVHVYDLKKAPNAGDQ